MLSCGPGAPKTTFVGVRKVRIAVCETVTVFNTGAANKAVIMGLSGVNPSQSILKAMRQQDSRRIKSAAQKVSSKFLQSTGNKGKSCEQSESRKGKSHTLQGLLAVIQSLRQQFNKERNLSPRKTFRSYHPLADRNLWR